MMGIWLIVYRVKHENLDEYLTWFHELHIAEKLARDGYDWAAHYKVDAIDEGDTRFLALFGGESTSVFYDPSPAQLKPTQDELTRNMIGLRFDVKMFILSSEWSWRDTDLSDSAALNTALQANRLNLGIFPESINDQTAGAFCAQQLFPSLSDAPQTLSLTKLLASTGAERHLVMQELDTALENASDHQLWPTHDDNSGDDVGIEFLGASRIWPG